MREPPLLDRRRAVGVVVRLVRDADVEDGGRRGQARAGRGSLAFQREGDDGTGRPYWYNADTGKRLWRTSDREAGALKRINATLARYPGLTAYVQGDPRGCALYILRPGDVLEGHDASSCYSRGIAVCP